MISGRNLQELETFDVARSSHIQESAPFKEPISQVRSVISDIVQREVENLSSKNRPIMIAKIAAIFIFLTANFLYTRKFSQPRPSVECIEDKVFKLTQGLNEKANTDPNFLKAIQISSSAIVDFADLTMLYTYYNRGVNIRLPIELLVFYVMRGIV